MAIWGCQLNRPIPHQTLPVAKLTQGTVIISILSPDGRTLTVGRSHQCEIVGSAASPLLVCAVPGKERLQTYKANPKNLWWICVFSNAPPLDARFNMILLPGGDASRRGKTAQV